MIVVGIDQSIAQPGIAVVARAHDGRWSPLRVASIATSKVEDLDQHDSDAKRIQLVFEFIANHLMSARDAGRGRVVCVGVEGLVGSKSHRALGAMSQAYATAISACVACGHTPLIVLARDAKVAACGNASAEKSDVVAAMTKLWSWLPRAAMRGQVDAVRRENEAIADALAIANVLAQTVDANAQRGRAA